MLGCLELNLQNNPDNLVAMHVESKNIQCGIKKKSMKMYDDNMVEEENTTRHIRSFKNWFFVQKLVTSMPVD